MLFDLSFNSSSILVKNKLRFLSFSYIKIIACLNINCFYFQNLLSLQNSSFVLRSG